MGDRGNIVVGKVWLYTHWDGSNIKDIVKAALERGKSRWNDEPYLTRIIFCEMIKGDVMGLSGYGISAEMGDNGHPIIFVECDKQVVQEKKESGEIVSTWTFEDFIKQEGKKLLKEFEDRIEIAKIKALSTASIERPLTNEEFTELKTLAKKHYGIGE